MLQVFQNGAVPVDFTETRIAAAHTAVQRSCDRLLHRRGEFGKQLIDHLAHHLARQCLVFFGNDAAEAHQGGDQMHIRHDIRQHFLFREQTGEIEALDRVLLHYLHHRLRKKVADVAQPGADLRRGCTQAATPLAFVGFVIECRQRLVHPQLALTQHTAGRFLRFSAQHQPPALHNVIHTESSVLIGA